MNLNIGEKISKFRKDKSKTQEQLADYVGISVAAVSKWETKQSYPDITLLPSIADFFEVTIDSLMDYKVMDNKKNLEIIYKSIDYAECNCDYDTALPIIYNALKKYPNDGELLKKAANMLSMKAYDSETKNQDFKDAIEYYERTLTCVENKEEKLWIKHSISFIYDAMGDTQKALDKILEINASYAFDLQVAHYKYKLGNKKEAKKIIQNELWKKAFMFYMSVGQLANCYEDEDNLEMALEAQKLHAKFLSSFVNDIPNYADYICVFSYLDIAKYCLKLNKDTEMWENLEKSTYHAVRFDKNPSYKIESIKFMDGIGENSMVSNTSKTMVCHELLGKLQNDFKNFAKDEKYTKIFVELNTVKRTKREAGIWKE